VEIMNIITTNENKKIADKIWDKNDALDDLSDEELDLLGEVMSSIERPVDPEVISDDSQNSEVPYMRLLKRDE
jgi:hypothetical protein